MGARMASINGHGPKRAILYARVSTDEQARSGYSLAQQIEALREYAGREGYEVAEEVLDPGQSGASLERPGMDRVRDMVATGSVSVVFAQDRDRFAREPAYLFLLKREFEEHGTKLRALSDRGDDSPEGELMNGIFDQFAKFERAKIAERARRGLRRKANEGYINLSTPNYGFRHNEGRNELLVYEPEMLVVKKIFHLAAGGWGMMKIHSHLYAQGIPSPKGAPVWDRRVVHDLVMNDVYRPHTFTEIAALVAPEVAARLDPNKEYGISWYGQRKVTVRTVSEPDGRGGRRYRKRKSVQWRPKEEWVAIPVPAYLPRVLVDQARAAMEASKGSERKHLARGWELRGVMRCPCGHKMSTQSNKPEGKSTYHYYVCRRRRTIGKKSPCSQKSLKATEVETTVWRFVSDLLKEPERIRAGMNTLIEQERAEWARDPAAETKVWADKVEECDRLRSAYQDQQAAGLMTLDELSSKLEDLETARRRAHSELEALEAREKRAAKLEEDRDALLASMAETMPEDLDNLTPEEKNKVYRILRLEVTPASEGYQVSGALSTPCALPGGHLMKTPG
jgi:site-specific DNA recombinase